MFEAKTSLRSSIVTTVFSSLLFTVFGCGQAELSQTRAQGRFFARRQGADAGWSPSFG